MVNRDRPQKQTITLRHLLVYGYIVLAIGGWGVYWYFRAASISPGLESFFVLITFLFLLMILSYTYVLAEPKETCFLTGVSRFFIIYGIVGWLSVTLYSFFLCYYSASYACRFATVALFFPLTTVIVCATLSLFKRKLRWTFTLVLQYRH